MNENELPHLVTLIGALRAARTEDNIFGSVTQADSKSDRAATFSVRARTTEGTYEYDEVGTGHSVVYNPSEASLRVTYDGEPSSKSFEHPHFPMFAPAGHVQPAGPAQLGRKRRRRHGNLGHAWAGRVHARRVWTQGRSV